MGRHELLGRLSKLVIRYDSLAALRRRYHGTRALELAKPEPSLIENFFTSIQRSEIYQRPWHS